jgi:maltooligosyltrehalose trehalohydrolase
VLLTGETDAYYADYALQPTEQLARCLSQGFVFQGHITRHGEPRGEPSEHLPSTAFILFLQNHDQIGNRAFGERLHQLADPRAVQAATVLLLLSPMIPLMFMGDEFAAEQPFLFFTSHHGELADLVREGRRNEFAAFSAFTDPHQREKIPDPNAEQTFHASQPVCWQRKSAETLALYRRLLQLRHQYIIPNLSGTQALGAHARAWRGQCVWRLGDGSELRIDLNLSDTPVVNPAQSDAVWLFQQPPAVALSERPTARVLRACQPHGRNPLQPLDGERQ